MALNAQSFAERLPDCKQLAGIVAAGWDVGEVVDVQQVNLSENAMYRVQARGGNFALRLSQPGYQSLNALRSEMHWLVQLGEQDTLRAQVVRPVQARDDGWIVGQAGWHLALFEWIDGQKVSRDALSAKDFAALGRLSTQLTHVSAQMPRPAWFERSTWSAASFLAPHFIWGDWREHRQLSAALRRELEAVEGQVLAQLSTPLNPPQLIHGDLRAANLLRRADGTLVALDFDDCAVCNPVFDLAAALSFDEALPSLAQRANSWIKGAQETAPGRALDWSQLPAWILLRRLSLIGWMASHPHAPEAQELGAAYVAETAGLLERLQSELRAN